MRGRPYDYNHPDHGEFRGGWKRRSIEMSRFFNGKPRGIEAYGLVLGFGVRDIKGERILDIGSGVEDQFSKEVEEANVEASVVSFSPDFVYPDVRENAKAYNPSIKAVAGLAQSLPFRNESFDRVVSIHLLDHLDSKDTFFLLLKESARVLKPGGTAGIGPVYLHIRGWMHEAQDRLDAICKSEGISIVQEQVPTSYGHERLYDDHSGMHYGDTPYTRLILKKNKGEKK